MRTTVPSSLRAPHDAASRRRGTPARGGAHLRAPHDAHLRRLAAVGGGLLGVAALAGCAPTAPAPPSAPSSSAASTAGPASSSASSSSLKDGTYSAKGDYRSPGGPSAVAVTVTLRSGTITAVKVDPKAPNPTAQQYESQFASGIAAVAVGKPIAGLQVGAVSGSSLTSQGFEKALATIRSEAAS